MPEHPPGTPTWVDLATPDVDAAIAFYGELFGWSAPAPAEGGGGYRMFEQDAKVVAGVGPIMGPGQPTAWTSYVSVADADATVAAARAAGGMVLLEPMDVMEAGRMAVVADPVGAALGLWQPGRHGGAELFNEPVSLAWNELNTRDVEAPKPFYRAVFGWEAETVPQGDHVYTSWQLDGRPVGGMVELPSQAPAEVPSHWLAYFAVNDPDATAERATAAGGRLVFGPMEIPAGRFAVLADPQGATFGIFRM